MCFADFARRLPGGNVPNDDEVWSHAMSLAARKQSDKLLLTLQAVNGDLHCNQVCQVEGSLTSALITQQIS